MILTTEQARAVYDAMCALNNVGGRCSDLRLDGNMAIVENRKNGAVVVFGDSVERHDSQAAFATAYGLQPRQPVAEVAEGFVFLLRKQPDGTRWPVGTKLYV